MVVEIAAVHVSLKKVVTLTLGPVGGQVNQTIFMNETRGSDRDPGCPVSCTSSHVLNVSPGEQSFDCWRCGVIGN